MYIYSFEKLEVWKLAKDFCIYIYKLTGKFPMEEKFGMVSQMRRASVSIASNIAEGSSRISKKEQSHFYTIAYSSAIELLNQLIISFELSLIHEIELNESRLKIEPITKGLSNLKRSALNPSTPKPLNK
jgi:four helix bundle protein